MCWYVRWRSAGRPTAVGLGGATQESCSCPWRLRCLCGRCVRGRARWRWVGAGAVGRGGPPVAVGGPPGTGGLTGGAIATVAEGMAGGASAAFKVMRTVSFFKGTLDVCLDGAGGWFSFSLMRSRVFGSLGVTKTTCPRPVKLPARDFPENFPTPKVAVREKFLMLFPALRVSYGCSNHVLRKDRHHPDPRR